MLVANIKIEKPLKHQRRLGLPWYKPCPVGTSLHALSPTLHKRKSHRGKGPIVKPLAISWHCGDNQKVMALHLSLAILVGGGGRGYK